MCISLLALGCAFCKWQEIRTSRRFVIFALLMIYVPIYVISLIPWYNVLQFDYVASRDPSVYEWAGITSEEAEMIKLMPPQERELIDASIQQGFALNYRLSISTAVQASVTSTVASFIPALLKASWMCKLLAPELSFWGWLFFLLPIVDLMIIYPQLAFYVQFLAEPLAICFMVIGCCTSVGYIIIAYPVNTPKGLVSDITYARAKIGFADKIWMLTFFGKFAFLIALFWPVIRAIFDNTDSNDAVALWDLMDELGLNLFFLLEFIFNFLASKFVTTIVCLDLMSQFIVAFQTQDQMYTAAHATADKTYEGASSIAAMWATGTTPVKVAPHNNSK